MVHTKEEKNRTSIDHKTIKLKIHGTTSNCTIETITTITTKKKKVIKFFSV